MTRSFTVALESHPGLRDLPSDARLFPPSSSLFVWSQKPYPGRLTSPVSSQSYAGLEISSVSFQRRCLSHVRSLAVSWVCAGASIISQRKRGACAGEQQEFGRVFGASISSRPSSTRARRGLLQLRRQKLSRLYTDTHTPHTHTHTHTHTERGRGTNQAPPHHHPSPSHVVTMSRAAAAASLRLVN